MDDTPKEKTDKITVTMMMMLELTLFKERKEPAKKYEVARRKRSKAKGVRF